MFLRIMEISLSFLAFLFLLTQVVFPLVARRQLFPMFRRKQRELEEELVKEEQKKADAELRSTIDEVAGKRTNFYRQRKRKWNQENKK